ncbi:MAG: hypothetical protein AUH41_02920 [Gemmatimonadetes bacterium 13_1_40CM_66_11]|nr:MAG: hypothetical protein AUH41_02920 [Gemmatimonadetes bacterium 13_1_40CM_66_11]
MTIHVGLAAGRWAALSLPEQLANVGSEVDRAITAWEARRTDRFDKALTRALELFDLTARDDRWRGHRRREILRSREEFCRLFFDAESPAGAARTLSAYFLAFVVLAQRSRSTKPAGPPLT